MHTTWSPKDNSTVLVLSVEPAAHLIYPAVGSSVQFWRCESLSTSWGSPGGCQLLLLILAVGHFKRWVCTIDFSNFHQLGWFFGFFFVHLSFFFNIYKMGAGISAPLKKIRFIRAFLPCLRFYSPPFWKDSYRCHYSLSTKERHSFTGVSWEEVWKWSLLQAWLQ